MKWIRWTAALVTAVLCAGMAPPAGPVQAQQRPAAPDDEAVARADAAIAEHPEAVRSADGDAYQVWRVIHTPTGAAHVRYAREFRGLPVIGGDFVVHLDPEGGFTGVSVSLDRPLTVGTEPRLTGPEAQQVVREAVDLSPLGDPELVVDAAAGAPRLAWRLPAGPADGGVTVLVDAADGRIIRQLPDHQEVTGSGDSVYAGTVDLDTTSSGGQYELVDPLRGNATTCNLNHAWSGACPVFTDADGAWGDGNPATDQSAAVDVHYGAAMAYDYYQDAHGRAGVFDTGVGVTSRVHRGVAWKNASWSLTQKVMSYGDGAGGVHPLVSLDVAGHEMTHGVTQAMIPPSGLIYSGESGGLNEATSDILGTMVEFYAANPGDPPDYLVGEKIDYFGNGKPLRYLHDPAQDGYSVNCWYSGVGNLDVHFSSGIGNHFFFLLAQGSGLTPYGYSPTCNGGQVLGIGRDKAAAIWYRALEAYFTSAESYSDARNDTLAAAAELYGRCGGEWLTVAAAWSAVGVSGPGSIRDCFLLHRWQYVLLEWPEFPIPDPGPLHWVIELAEPGTTQTIQVGVHIVHPRRGDLQIDLVAPDGREYLLKEANPRDLAADVTEYFDVRLPDPARPGEWQLVVTDLAEGAEGHLLGWGMLY